jgi:hypothetical protein
MISRPGFAAIALPAQISELTDLQIDDFQRTIRMINQIPQVITLIFFNTKQML